MPRKIKYLIIDHDFDNPTLRKVMQSGIVSQFFTKDKAILGRHGTNKTTLKRIIENEKQK